MNKHSHCDNDAGTLSRPSIGWPLVLVALASVMLRRWQDGAVTIYVHPVYEPLIVVTAVGLLVLAGAQLWTGLRRGTPAQQSSGPGITWRVAIVGLAVIVAALVPVRPLGSLVAAGQDTQSFELPPSYRLPDETTSWTLLEWAQALGGGVRHERVVGRPVSVVGFVHRPRQGGQPGEFLVTRFVVRCCAADGFAVSLPVRHPDADGLPLDSWVRVDGVLRFDDRGSTGGPYVEADALTPVSAPAVPYLSPT